MNLLKSSKKLLAPILATALALPAFGAAAGAASAAGPVTASLTSPVSHYDYYQDVYPSLANKTHVFKTTTYEDLVTILGSEGTYAILIGGAWSAETQADIGYINEVAQEYGISTIYNFDTKLDGQALNIADSSNKYSHYYVDLANKYFANLSVQSVTYASSNDISVNSVTYTTPSNTITSAPKVEAPYLLVYNKEHKDDNGNSAPIVASLEKHGAGESTSYDSSYFSTPENVTSYKDKVRNVLGAAQPTEYRSLTNWEFIGNAFNTHFWEQNPAYDPSTPEVAGKPKVTIFQKGVDNYDVFEHVTYDELKHLLATEGNYAILFGGSWCPNTQADIRFIANTAKEYGVDKIYFWDTKLTAGIDLTSALNSHDNDDLQVRTNNHDYAYLYGDIVSTYLTNIKTQNKLAANPTQISYTKNGVALKADRLQVPFFFAYNKNNVDADGAAAPILGHTELMYSWTGASSNIAPDYSFGAGIEIGVNNKNLLTALKSLFSRLEAVPTGLGSQAASSSQAADGKITGTKNKALEYKLASVANSVYTANDPTKDSIDNLPAGTYYVRYASKPGYQGPVTASGKPVTPAAIPYNAGQSVEVAVLASSGSTGGNGGTGGNSGTTQPSDTGNGTGTNPGTGGSVIISADVPSKTDASTGTTLASLAKEAADKLLESVKNSEAAGKPAVLELKVETTDGTKTAQLNIPKDVLDGFAKDTKASLQINYGSVGTITLDYAALKAVSAQNGTGDVTIIIAKSELTEEGKQILGDRPVYDLSVFVGHDQVSSFGGGSAHVSLPYVLKAGESPEAVIVYYVADDGSLETVRGQYRSSTKSVEFSTPHFSQYIVGYNKVSFADVSGTAWYSKAVGYLAARDIVTGTDNGAFDPQGQVTRGQFVVLLLKSYGIAPEAAGADNFADAGNTYYTGYLAAAKKLGIATGVGDNLFTPNQSITRQELFTLLHRALEQLGELPTQKTGASVGSYTDSGDIASFASEAFQAFVESGIVTGDGSKLNPKGVTSRAEAAQVLYQLLSK